LRKQKLHFLNPVLGYLSLDVLNLPTRLREEPLFEAEKTDLTITAERLRELTSSLFAVISILKNPPENPWQLVM